VRSAEQSFPPRTGSVRAARHFLDEELERWQQQGLQWTAELLLSELATNAVLHAGTEFTVVLLLLADGAVRIEVTDRVAACPASGATTRRRPRAAGSRWSSTCPARGASTSRPEARSCGAISSLSLSASEGCRPTSAGVDLDAFLGADDQDGLPGLGPAPATAASPPNVDEPVT